MALLSISQLQKSFGTDLVFAGASFEIQDHDHIGLVGVNGSGKTTLFKILTGDLPYDSGEIYKSKECRIGYMEQHVCRDLDRSAYNEVLTVFSSLLAMEQELEDINTRLQVHPDNRLIERQMLLNDQFAAQGGLTCRARARSALLGLGFSDEQMGMPVGVLSGGQKAKLQLAKMLLSGANLLLLDEPTNHLDIQSVEWLEDFLRGFPGAYLVISHDRFFLDTVTERTFEMEHQRLTLYKGNYTQHLGQKEENALTIQRKYDNTMREIKRLEGIVAQQRQWNREKNIRTAESKLKVIARLEKTLVKPDSVLPSIHFGFGASQRGGNDVMFTENLALSFDNKPLFSHVDMEVHRQERIFLIGPNGCGKTSLLKILMGEYEATAGSVRFGAGIDVGYYDQMQSGLDETKTVLDEIWDRHPRMTETEIRNALAVFLFRGEDVYKMVSALSGGERARLLLLRLMLSKANFLLLDEPTNHLDIQSCEALEDALLHYDGTLFIVSHDRYLINKLADRIYYLDRDGAQEYIGNYEEYLARRKEEQEEKAVQSAPKVNEYRLRKEKASELRKARTALSRLETETEQNDERIRQLGKELQNPETASDFEKTMELSAEMDRLNERNEELLLEWEELSGRIEEMEKAT
ncbi:MAG TPA: ABC-F family ATP-binding cassette domain-containing protein [Candidatus Gallacutalibacter pullistercoris]|nr:ABC-F family ATP-binding cassette domain-containing protein [Candidatus Gallacutalibacter pullistercoris]